MDCVETSSITFLIAGEGHAAVIAESNRYKTTRAEDVARLQLANIAPAACKMAEIAPWSVRARAPIYSWIAARVRRRLTPVALASSKRIDGATRS
eukprot:2988120-Pyramimonas_sp.AAC.1